LLINRPFAAYLTNMTMIMLVALVACFFIGVNGNVSDLQIKTLNAHGGAKESYGEGAQKQKYGAILYNKITNADKKTALKKNSLH